MLRVLRRVPFPRICGYCSSSSKEPTDKETVPVIPEEPTNCCMSGCANCVWIDYAKELTKIYEDRGSKAQQLILKKISDPTLKVFLQMELKSLAKKDNN